MQELELNPISKHLQCVQRAKLTILHSFFPLFSFLQAKGSLGAAIVLILVDV